jgi:hypothetical protein
MVDDTRFASRWNPPDQEESYCFSLIPEVKIDVRLGETLHTNENDSQTHISVYTKNRRTLSFFCLRGQSPGLPKSPHATLL